MKLFEYIIYIYIEREREREKDLLPVEPKIFEQTGSNPSFLKGWFVQNAVNFFFDSFDSLIVHALAI